MTTAAGGLVDVILCNDMLSVADLRSFLPAGIRDVPIVCYFHENQLTYPIPEEQERDFQYGMTNITSCLAADAVWFNSRFHREDFLAAVGGLWLLTGLPRFFHPTHASRHFKRATNDRFFICIEARDPLFDARRTEAFAEQILEHLNPDRRHEVVEGFEELLMAVREATECYCPGAFEHLLEGFPRRSA